jgi:uncharacterized protein (TIGR02145 family)
MPKSILIFLLASLISVCFSQNTVTDNSGNVYKTVKIGNQIWMAENLRTEKYNNGDPIEQITSDRYWIYASDLAIVDSTLEKIAPFMCYYNNLKQKNNALYNWYVVYDERGVCPNGWHIPSSYEFLQLTNFLGGVEDASKKLKSTSLWDVPGNNLSGFNALPIGVRLPSGEFNENNISCIFLTDEYINVNDWDGYIKIIGLELKSIDKESNFGNYFINIGASIRCLKN